MAVLYPSIIMKGSKDANEGGWDDYDGSGDNDYDASGSGDDYMEVTPPCIGLCLIYKQRGLEMPSPPKKRPCVGKCIHRRQLGLPLPKPMVLC